MLKVSYALLENNHGMESPVYDLFQYYFLYASQQYVTRNDWFFMKSTFKLSYLKLLHQLCKY